MSNIQGSPSRVLLPVLVVAVCVAVVVCIWYAQPEQQPSDVSVWAYTAAGVLAVVAGLVYARRESR